MISKKYVIFVLSSINKLLPIYNRGNLKKTKRMKKFVAIMGLFVASFTVYGFTSGDDKTCPTTEYKTYHENGELKFLGAYDCNGVLHGRVTEYFSNGVLAGSGEYHHGVRSGAWTVYCINGTHNYVLQYENGKVVSACLMQDNIILESRVYKTKETIQLVETAE